MSTNGERERQPRVTTEQWLRGYFFKQPDDVLGRGEAVAGVWKNIDFLRLRDSALHLLDPRPGRTILDIGSAEGATMVYCGLQGATVYGQDLDPEAVAEANRALAQYGITGEARVGNATDLRSFGDGSMDGVIASDFFEHITDDDKIACLRECVRVLKPGGAVVLKTPNLTYLKLALAFKRSMALLRGRNPFRIVIPHTHPSGDMEHIGLTTRFRLARCLQAANLFNYEFRYVPLRRFGRSALVEIFSTEIPVLRDWFSEDLLVRAYKPIALSHFPD